MNDRRDARILNDAFKLRMMYGTTAEALCSQAMDHCVTDPERWSVARQLKEALRLMGTAPAAY